jgi:hypothetical protein
MTDLTLPDFGEPTKLAWPPPTPSLAAQVATSMVHRPNPGANWWQEREERARAVREEHERAIEHYASMARQREEREAAEAQKRGNGPGHQVGS